VPVGPFRMMARDQVKIELVPVTGMIPRHHADDPYGPRPPPKNGPSVVWRLGGQVGGR
jgi:hypothetical protein